MSRCRNLLLQTTVFRTVAKSISLTPLGEVVEWMLNCSTVESKDTFLPDLRVEIPEDNLDVMGLAFVVQVLYVRVEGILDHIVLLCRGGV